MPPKSAARPTFFQPFACNNCRIPRRDFQCFSGEISNQPRTEKIHRGSLHMIQNGTLVFPLSLYLWKIPFRICSGAKWFPERLFTILAVDTCMVEKKSRIISMKITFPTRSTIETMARMTRPILIFRHNRHEKKREKKGDNLSHYTYTRHCDTPTCL